MNKKFLVPIIGSMLLLTWCFWTPQINENKDDNTHFISNYSWTLTSVWIWPEVSGERNVDFETLVLRWRSYDVVIHMYIPKDLYEKAFLSKEDYLPWNKIEIVWKVEKKSESFWNRYYTVKNIESVKVVGYPNSSEMESIIQTYGYCEDDSDCVVIWWVCPLECYIWINKNFVDTVTDIMSLFESHIWDDICVYDCPFRVKPMCRYNTCMVSYWDDYDIPYYDWDEGPKEALFCGDDPSEIICDETDWVVCWNDEVTYANKCDACKSWVTVYVNWKC